jgi:hypothetical protein
LMFFALKSEKVDFWSNVQIFADQNTPENPGFWEATHLLWELRGVLHSTFL